MWSCEFGPMVSAFSKILIPVDFSLSTEIAVSRAMGLIEKEHSNIQLLHIISPRSVWQSLTSLIFLTRAKKQASGKYIEWEAEKKLAQWKATIEEYAPGIKVNTAIVQATSVQDMIIHAANTEQPDLIIIGKQGDRRHLPGHPTVSSEYLAQKSNCPVLTIKPGSLHGQTKIILLPVGDFLPERKLELAILIARKYRAQVHLVAIQETGSRQPKDPSRAFIAAWHQLKKELHYPVEYFPGSIANTAKATLDYAEMVMADMILVNPEKEGSMAAFGGSRHISDLLSRDSRIQVLDVRSPLSTPK